MTSARQALRILHTHRRLVAAAALGPALAILLLGAATNEPPEGPGKYIVQAKDVRTAEEAVRQVDGIITHRLAIIRAVGARLTEAQRSRVAELPGVRRVWEDRDLRTSSAGCAVGEGLLVEDKKVLWYFTNISGHDLTLERLAASWQIENEELKKVKLGGKEIFKEELPGPSVTIDGSWRGDEEDRVTEPGETVELSLEFTEKGDRTPAGYGLALSFTEGCSLDLTPPSEDPVDPDDDAEENPFTEEPELCAVSLDQQMIHEVRRKKVSFLVENEGDPVALEWLDLAWPAQNENLKKIYFGGVKVFDHDLEPAAAFIDSNWKVDAHERVFPAASSALLVVYFEKEIDDDPAGYSLAAGFSGGCSIAFTAEDGSVDGSPGDGEKDPDTTYPTLVRADLLQRDQIDGYGVTIAFLDTGLPKQREVEKNPSNDERVLAQYDAIRGRLVEGRTDDSGHGSHVASIAVGSGRVHGADHHQGIAPYADVVSVKAFDGYGSGTYADVIRGIGWIVAYKDFFGIRVLNLSFSAPPQSHYWDDPLNQAVMEAWRAGIVVVASAGNWGPGPATVGVPGNVPYVITVGAISNNYTSGNEGDDFLASFSSVGPTFEAFVKPEVVAPGGHLLGIMERNYALIAWQHPEYSFNSRLFEMSGTSQATAVVSGLAALVLQNEPWLSPDQVKHRLMSTARPAVQGDRLAYSVFQQGAGLVDGYAAVHSGSTERANRGLDVDLDLSGAAHFMGRARLDESGNFYLDGLDGYSWNGEQASNDGYLWSDGYLWNDGYLWSDGYLWNDAYLWSDALTETVSINGWVEPE